MGLPILHPQLNTGTAHPQHRAPPFPQTDLTGAQAAAAHGPYQTRRGRMNCSAPQRALGRQHRGAGVGAAPCRAPAPRHTSATSASCSPKATSRYFCLPLPSALRAVQVSTSHLFVSKIFCICCSRKCQLLGNEEPSYRSQRHHQTPLFPCEEKPRLRPACTKQHHHLTRYFSANFTPGNVFLGKTQEVGNFGQENLTHGFGKVQEALGTSRQGKRLHTKHRSAPLCTQSKGDAGHGQGWEDGAAPSAQAAAAGREPWHGRAAGSSSAPSRALTRSFVYKRQDLMFPVPSSPGTGGRLPGNRSPGEDLLR